MKTIDFSFFIERYNAGEMNEAERTWFEKELGNNIDLRKEVDIRKKTDKVLEDQAVIQLRNKLAAIESRRSVPDPVRKHPKYAVIRYAAIFIGLAIIGSLFIMMNRNMPSDEIFSKYYTSYDPAATSRSLQTGENTDYKTAVEFYNVHDYRTAAIYFSKVIDKDPSHMESALLYGVSNLEEKNYPEAEKSFDRVMDNNGSLYQEDAEWYLALCYLKTEEKTKAVEQLTSIKKSTSIYRKDAGKILKRIR